MPVSVIVGAQYGSEGKGKVAFEWAQRRGAAAAVRVGGPNSGHTVIHDGLTHVFRQLPTAALLEGVVSVLPPGAYIDVEVLLAEIHATGATSANLVIDPRAIVVTPADVEHERGSGLRARIGSTASGLGAAVERRVRRDGSSVRAGDVPELGPYLGDTLPLLRDFASRQRVIIEGTQGYGLSLLHGLEGDFATSRDTTAAAFVAEAGLSPMDVDEVVLVARSFPIRVAGNSGSLPREVSWSEVGQHSGRSELIEHTTVTKRVRRVGEFEPEIVRRAIYANSPTHIVLNHLDYVADLRTESGRASAAEFLLQVESALGQKIDFVGVDPAAIQDSRDFLTSSSCQMSVPPSVPE